MAKWPGIGKRIRERFHALGYVKDDGRADVIRFALDHRYVHTYVYKWLDDTTPSRDNLYRLARDLGVSPAWLLFGDAPVHPPKHPRRPVAISGASAPAPSKVDDSESNAPYRKLRRFFLTQPVTLSLACA